MSKNCRLIARLDIKGKNLIKSIQLEGLRVIGDPYKFAQDYYEDGADELILMDAVASLYGRNHLEEVVSEVARDLFIPVTVGGGIRSVDDAYKIIRSGADKVAINTAAVKNPKLIMDIARRFGSQAVVLSIEAKKTNDGFWEVYTDNGREKTGRNVVEWAIEAESHGVGEIILTSVDREGTRKGYDSSLISAVASRVNVPVIASGGMGKIMDLVEAVNSGADAVAMADILHNKRATIGAIRNAALENGVRVRSYG